MQDREALLPSTTTTTPPLLERETLGLYCPLQPQPLPCSNARRKGFLAHPHHCLTPPLPRSKLEGFFHHHHLSVTQTLLEHETGGSILSSTTSLLVPPLLLKTKHERGGGLLFTLFSYITADKVEVFHNV